MAVTVEPTSSEAMRQRLAKVGKDIERYRRLLASLTDERQALVADLRALGVPLVECARLARISPEAIRIQERRRTS